EWIVVAGSGAVQTIIDKSEPGDVIRLAPGMHQGPVVIDRAVSLLGQTGSRIDGGGAGTVITITAPGAAVANLEIVGSGSSHEDLDSGVKMVKGATGARITGNVLTGNLVGIDIHGAKDVYVADNRIVGRRDHRMNARGNAVYIWNAPGAVVENNEIRYGRDGIFVNTSSRNTFRNNTFDDLRFAVHYMYTQDSVISGNISRNNHVGYAFMYSRDLIVRGNASLGDRDHGIMLNYANQALVEGNRVVNGGTKCLFMYNANKNQILDNRFQGCPIGIHFTAGSERNDIVGNAFVGNRTQVKYVGSRYLEWDQDGRGNYWSDHAAFDVDGDGVADMPYRPNDLMDHILWTQPAARLLLGSPAVQLIRWAQSKFPSLMPGGVVDNHPLMAPTAKVSLVKEDAS
ncbi:MAG: nitrous oxide reductase family maturation protein NosD, partial [Alphaproteobacteria bacterium]